MAIVALAAGRAYALSSTATVNIDVTINASVSVAVMNTGSYASTPTATAWSTTISSFVSASTATVFNDSGGLSERWALSTNASSIDQGLSTGWTLNSTTNTVDLGQDQFSILAMFVSSATSLGGCPALNALDWTGPSSTTVTTSITNKYGGASGSQYYFTRWPDSNGYSLPDSGTSTYKMYAYNAADSTHKGQRGLCWKIMGPPSTTMTATQNIQLIITASLN